MTNGLTRNMDAIFLGIIYGFGLVFTMMGIYAFGAVISMLFSTIGSIWTILGFLLFVSLGAVFTSFDAFGGSTE